MMFEASVRLAYSMLALFCLGLAAWCGWGAMTAPRRFMAHRLRGCLFLALAGAGLVWMAWAF